MSFKRIDGPGITRAIYCFFSKNEGMGQGLLGSFWCAIPKRLSTWPVSTRSLQTAMPAFHSRAPLHTVDEQGEPSMPPKTANSAISKPPSGTCRDSPPHSRLQQIAQLLLPPLNTLGHSTACQGKVSKEQESVGLCLLPLKSPPKWKLIGGKQPQFLTLITRSSSGTSTQRWFSFK